MTIDTYVSGKLEQLHQEKEGTLVRIKYREKFNDDVYYTAGHLLFRPGQDFIMLINGIHPEFDIATSRSADKHQRFDLPLERFLDYEKLVPADPNN